MKNLHLIATDKPSVLILRQDRKLFFTGYGGQLGKVHGLIKDVPQHIYITSDEEIKEGDWYYLPRTNSVHKCIEATELNLERRLGVAKIILTTDQDLIADGVQSIDDEFLEWFVKNSSCEFVEILIKNKTFDKDGFISSVICDTKNVEKIYSIIPQEEPKPELLPDFKITKNIFDFVTDLSDTNKEEPKYITVKEPCSLCDGTGETTFSGTYTTQRKCDLCNGEKYWNKKILVDQPKQERVEEAANNFAKLLGNKHETIFALEENAFIEGAKWQAERMYSEEEVKDLFNQYKEEFSIYRNMQILNAQFEEWFNQNKKK
jgi:hypothetical protein